MTSSHAFRRFAFAYGTAFAVLYLVALKLDLALFTVYPSLGIVLPGTHHSRDTVDPAMGFLAPAMYWYGWTATAALGALVVGLLAAWVPEQWTRRFWSGLLWLIPALAMIGCVYLTLPWFRLQPLNRRLTSAAPASKNRQTRDRREPLQPQTVAYGADFEQNYNSTASVTPFDTLLTPCYRICRWSLRTPPHTLHGGGMSPATRIEL